MYSCNLNKQLFFRPLIPYTLALFIQYFAGVKTPETYRNAHIYNLLMNLLSIGTTLIFNHLQLSQGAVGMRVRIASCSLLYRKVCIAYFYFIIRHSVGFDFFTFYSLFYN